MKMNHELRVKFATLAVALLGALAASAQPTNSAGNPDPLDYKSYRIVTERNIFNQNRTGRYARAATRQSRARQTKTATESFALVGTMSYPKGEFAFFDGTGGNYKLVLEPGKRIADYTLKEITPQSVTLVGTNGAPITMSVGSQMRREESGWQLSEHGETPAANSNATAESAAPAANDGNSGVEMNDVLKKLMQQREQEDSK